MNKKIIYIVIGLIIIISGFFIFNSLNNNDNTNNLTNITGNDELAKLKNEDNSKKEVELSSFSTYYGSSSEGRKTNIQITCETLNGTIVKSNDTFSFNDIIGQVTEEKGYMEADVIAHGEVVKALGGGNCQVSSTLYNVVLNVSEFEVIERHPHGKNVGYVEEDKDATVSYGSSLDFKFKNNLNEDVKLYFTADGENITVTAVKLESNNS